MRKMSYFGIITCATIGLVGCFRSPAPRFFTLTPIAERANSGAMSPQGPRVTVVSLTLPAYLLDPRMCIITDGNEVVRDEFERWAEDLDTNFRRVFVEDLSRELRSSNISLSDSSTQSAGAHALRAEVLSFDTDTAGAARLRVRWSLERDAAQPSFVISEWSETMQGDTPGARAQALSSLIAAFAREIAAQVPGTR
jgi:uncharacterized lipoprotein YmbA